MSRFFLSVALLTCVASAARADQGAQIAPITEDYQSPKMTRLRELNAQLATAMLATPTVDQLTDPTAMQASLDKMTAIADQVNAALVDSLRPNGAVAFSVVQDNVRVVQARIRLVKILRKASVALAALQVVADAHGEPTDAQLRDVADAFEPLDENKAVAPALYKAEVAWRKQIEKKLAEVVWPADLPKISLSRAELASAPVAFHGKISGKRWLPIAVVEVTAPLHALRFHGNFDRVPLRLRGPASNDNGLVVAPKDEIAYDRGVEVGTYVLEARGKGADVLTIDGAITDPNTPVARFEHAQVGDVAADAPLDHHRVDAIYPFLDRDLTMWERQQLFATAPRALFVYARDDMDKTDADPQQNSDAMPRKDEPLLVALNSGNGLVLYDAEGFAWTIRDWKMLATAPSGAPAVPAAIHPLALEFSPPIFDAKKDQVSPFGYFVPGTPGVDKTLAAMTKTIETWYTCTSKVIDKYGGSSANDYDLVTYSNGHVQKVQALSDVAWNEADRKCGTKSYEKKLQAFNKQLSDASNKMRAKLLDEARAAWAK